jgi:hypothetical protein
LPPPREYSFAERSALARKHDAAVAAILLANIPGARQAVPACLDNDKRGTDWWIEMSSGYWLSVDVKIREKDFGQDDLALETWSVVEKKVIGWTRNPDKRTDYILWYWIDTGKFVLVPFRPLCCVFQARWEKWLVAYKHDQQNTPDAFGGGFYHSECVFVPRRDLWQAMYNTSTGYFVATPEKAAA